MATATRVRTRRLVWLAVLAVAVAGTAGFLWYAHAQGWLAPAEAWAHHLVQHDKAAESGPGGMDMSMDMPGMKRGPHSPGAPVVPGYAEIPIPPVIQQRIGVVIGKVEEGPLLMSVRTVGVVRPNETQVSQVHLRTEGWVGKVFVNYTGQTVKKGEPLLAIYSPQFLTTQQEYLTALQAGRGAEEGPASLVALARQRLELWGVPDTEIRQLAKTGKTQTYLTLRSPQVGTVLVKNAYTGQYVTPQTNLYTVADLSTVWVQAEVYEYELPHVALGEQATVSVPGRPGQAFAARVVFVQPTVKEKTRTVEVRVELPNPDGRLKPGMFANVEIRHTMGRGLLVPTSAILRTGERDVAFRVEPGTKDRFVPVAVTISPLRFQGGRFHVVKGLKAGDRVVISANFLIDSESRLRAGSGTMAMPGMAMGGMKGMPGTDHQKTKH